MTCAIHRRLFTDPGLGKGVVLQWNLT